MHESTVARRYAQALIEVAAEMGAIERVGNELNSFAELLDRDGGDLRRALCTPLFTRDDKSAVLAGLLPRLGIAPLTSNFLLLLNEKGRLASVAEVARRYATLANERAGRVKVEVTTAEPMTPQIEAEVRATMEAATGKQVILVAKVDRSLIGGMVASVNGKVYDSSIRTRLEMLKQSLLQNDAGLAGAQSPSPAEA